MDANRGGRVEARTAHWAQELGKKRLARDECLARMAKSQEEDAVRTMSIAVERWAAIVASIRLLADAYNSGAGRVVLSVVEPSGAAIVTVRTGGEGTPSLTAALEDTVICIHAVDTGGVPHATEVRLRPDRDDAATAAYLLQDWMQRL